MPDALQAWAEKIAASAIPQEKVHYGPWSGSMRSRTSDLVPRTHIAGGSNFGYLPRTGTFKRRGGQVYKFDSGLGAAGVGLLPAKWSGKARWMEEFVSESISDGVPTVATLVTKETVASGLDDGRFSNLWVRDQVNNLNYTLGDEYGTTTYPALGSHQSFKFVPLWYDSGDGGITRGVSEFARRFLVSGSRRFAKVGNWTYSPSLLGTPSRWRNRFASGSALATESHPSDDVYTTGWRNTGGVAAGLYSDIDDPSSALDADTTCLRDGGNGGGSIVSGYLMQPIVVAVSGAWTLKVSIRRASGVYGSGPIISLCTGSSAVTGNIINHTIPAGSVAASASYSTYSYPLSAAEVIALAASASSFSLKVTDGSTVAETFISAIWIVGPGSATLENNRLVPSGPWAPLHGGIITKGNVVSDGGAVLMVPSGDVSAAGTWTKSSGSAAFYTYIDESSLDTLDYISSTVGGTSMTVEMTDPTYTPTASDTVEIVVTVQAQGAGASQMTVDLLETATVIYSTTVSMPSSTASVTHTLSLTSQQIQSVGSWNNVRLRFTVPSTAASPGRVSRAVINIYNLTIQTQGGWKGEDRFYWTTFFRFEDGSVWAPCTARPPSSLLPNGFNLFTVDIANPNTTYDKVTYSNLPKRPHGCTSLIIARSPKISAVKDDNLQLNPFEFRVVTEIEDATTTSYEDYYGDDASAREDVTGLILRSDHMMPPRARYIFGGDMRVCHSYGGDNPAAIEIAPVGRTADYDLNLSDDDATAYTSFGSWMQLKLDTSGVMTLTLIQGDGTTATSTSTFGSGTYTSIQQLVDAINATTCSNTAPDDQQWRAQLAPGANGDAAMTSLCPHNRAITACVVANTAKTITRAAGGLSKVGVGQLVASAVSGTTGAYITRIDSDTQLTYSGTLTDGSQTTNFYNDLGDAQITTPATSTLGFQRVICGALPGLLYFTKTYLNTRTLDKQSVWMTVASPLQAKSAANSFSFKTENRFNPPLSGAGISMGGAGVDQGFVVPYANHIYVIRNDLSQGTGQDKDYRMHALNPNRGCCAWNTVVPGNRFVPYLTSEGFCAADLRGEMQLSDDIYLHPAKGDATGTGDFGYEIPLCVAATAADTDAAYASARILKSAIRVSYRSSGSLPNRRVDYDFSTGNPSSGLEALFDPLGLQAGDGRIIRRPGDLWGWSLPHSSALSGDMAFTAMCEARTNASTDGKHLYGWSDANAGSTGDGRIDEFETGDTDNGTAIAGSVETPIERLGLKTLMSAQEATLEHSAPVSSTGAFVFHRGPTDTSYSMTPSTSATDLVRDIKMLPLAARAAVDRFYLGYTQATGSAREIRSIELRVKALRKSYR